MNRLHNKELYHYARQLRKNQTEEEARLWYKYLSKLRPRFHRQSVIGRYIVDFCCPRVKLVIELDGSQHYEDEGVARDIIRDEYLLKLGYTVLRYTNIELNRNFKGVCEDIGKFLGLNG